MRDRRSVPIREGAMETMKPISDARPDQWARLQFLFTDIDDTLTTDGQLPAEAYAMVESLAEAGLVVIPVTGRPAGWCDMIARFWPVGAVVGENGAFYFRYDRPKRQLERVFALSMDERQSNRRKLDKLRDTILAEVPGAAVASDQAYRDSDLAIDFCEDVARLSNEAINRIVELFEDAGASAKVSSIHVNGWFGTHDKLSMVRQLMREAFEIDIAQSASRSQCAFIGDSPNDAPMFGYFENSVGVANVVALADQCQALPNWVTSRPSGAGFCEFGAAVLAGRGA